MASSSGYCCDEMDIDSDFYGEVNDNPAIDTSVNRSAG